MSDEQTPAEKAKALQRFETSFEEWKARESETTFHGAHEELLVPVAMETLGYIDPAIDTPDGSYAAVTETDTWFQFAERIVAAQRISEVNDLTCAITGMLQRDRRTEEKTRLVLALQIVGKQLAGSVAFGTSRWKVGDQNRGPGFLEVEPDAKMGSYSADFRVTYSEHFPIYDRETSDYLRESVAMRTGVVDVIVGSAADTAAANVQRNAAFQQADALLFSFTAAEAGADPFRCAHSIVSALILSVREEIRRTDGLGIDPSSVTLG